MTNRLSALLDGINLGLFRCKIHGELINANQTFLKLLGADSLDSDRALEAFASFVRQDACADLFERLEQSRQPQDTFLQWQSTEGSSIPIKLSATLNMLSAGNAVIDGIVDEDPTRQPKHLGESDRRFVQGRLELLSPREREVMRCVVAGRTNKAIARSLGISAKTVEMHRSKMMKKLRVKGVAELVRLVISTEPDR